MLAMRSKLAVKSWNLLHQIGTVHCVQSSWHQHCLTLYFYHLCNSSAIHYVQGGVLKFAVKSWNLVHYTQCVCSAEGVLRTVFTMKATKHHHSPLLGTGTLKNVLYLSFLNCFVKWTCLALVQCCGAVHCSGSGDDLIAACSWICDCDKHLRGTYSDSLILE